MKTIYILLTGQIKLPNIFNNVINEYKKLKKKYKIKILLTTWKSEEKKNKNKDIETLYLWDGLNKNPGDGNIISQAIQYRKGMEYIEKDIKDKSNLFILKSRPDVLIKSEFLEKIINLNYKLKDEDILKYKIWTGWAHAIKPFYLEDAYFYSHYDTMKRLKDFDNNMFKREHLGQGISHIRRFIQPFLNKYEILNDYINNNNNLTNGMEKLPIDLKDEYTNNLIKTYYEIINKYFYIFLEKNNDIIFRPWNTKKLEINYKDSIENISKKSFNCNLKLIHNNIGNGFTKIF